MTEFNNQDCLRFGMGWWVYDYFSPSIKSYSEILLKRVVTIFDDIEGERDRAAERVLSSPAWGEDDYDRAMEAAYEHSMDAASEFIEMRGVFLITGVSGLFHIFEKQMSLQINKELRAWLESPIDQWRDIEGIIPKFKNKFGHIDKVYDLTNAFNDPNLIELRLVANAAKHGRGSSYEKLLSLGAAVVSEDRIHDEWAISSHSVIGVNISISPEDIERYRDAILRFWKVEGEFWAHRSEFGGGSARQSR